MTFTDVQPSDYFYEAVRYLYSMGAISGYADNTFRPYNLTTRSQLAKIAVLSMRWDIDTSGGPHFSDVPANYPFYTYVETAYSMKVISGYGDGSFHPSSNVTRGQLCKIMVSAMGWEVITPGQPHFRDVPAGSTFYGYVETAYSHGLVSGYECGPNCLEFRPGSNATRGQIAKIVYSALLQSAKR